MASRKSDSGACLVVNAVLYTQDPRTTRQSSCADSIELVKWHIARFDQLRVSVANRATAVLSANALILAGFAVFAGQYFGSSTERILYVQVIMALGAVLTLVLNCLSVAFATSALQNFRAWRAIFVDDIPAAPFFNHGDTAKAFTNFDSFRAAFRRYADADILNAALTELWVGIRLHRMRYRRLRVAIRLMLAAVAGLMLMASFSLVLVL